MTFLEKLWQEHDLKQDTLRPCLDALRLSGNDSQGLRSALRTVLPSSAIESILGELDANPSSLDGWVEELKVSSAKTVLAVFLQWARDGLPFCDMYNLGSIKCTCKDVPKVVSQSRLWKERVQFLSSCWLIPIDGSIPWQELFFSMVRPRWDGIYIGTCGYLHRVGAGASLTDTRRRMWIDYRRYLRLFPAGDDGIGRALILQDACPSDVAVELLLGLDPESHAPQARKQAVGERPQLAGRTMPGKYEFKDGQLDVKWHHPGLGDYHASLKVGSRKKGHNFSDQLEWTSYHQLNTRGDLTHFNLGLNSYGEPTDRDSNHFAPYSLRHCSSLAHLL